MTTKTKYIEKFRCPICGKGFFEVDEMHTTYNYTSCEHYNVKVYPIKGFETQVKSRLTHCHDYFYIGDLCVVVITDKKCFERVMKERRKIACEEWFKDCMKVWGSDYCKGLAGEMCKDVLN